MERTYRFKQADIAAAAPSGVARRALNLTLDTYGPYSTAYSRNGRYMLLGGSKGHIAVVDWHTLAVSAEFHVRETLHDVAFLHNSTMFAAAQKKFVHIYDHTGMEIHVLRGHVQPLALDFLPFHMLLASVGNAGFLTYQDVSTGAQVAQHRTRQGACAVMRPNPWNGVECLGHGDGLVTMWTPNLSTPAVKMLAHRGPVTALAVDGGGRYMVTGGLDARLKVWDVRAFRDEPLHNYFLPAPARAIDISARGCVAVGFGGHVQVWGRDFAAPERRAAPLTAAGAGALALGAPPTGGAAPRKAAAPYMQHLLPGSIVRSLRFRPLDDFLAVGHARGLASLLVPGSGEPNFDSLEADPFQTAKSRRELEVRALLDKLPPSSIALDPTAVGGLDAAAPGVRERERRADEAAAAAAAAAAAKARPLHALGTKRAKSASEKRKGKRAHNVITEQRAAAAERVAALKAKEREEQRAVAEGRPAEARGGDGDGAPRAALSRFFK